MDLLALFNIIIRGEINVPDIYLSNRISAKPVKEKPLNLNPCSSGNSPQPLTTERQGSSQEVGEGQGV